MRLRKILVLALLIVPLRSGAAAASACHVEAVPAATLLLPYFEVDLADPNGLTTLFSINNASATAVLAHVSIWSDLAVPVLNFNVYLTGYDVQTINLRDVVIYGNLPQTATAGQDPSDAISPRGQFSQDINFASCTQFLPPPPLPASYVSHLQLALTGRPSPVLANLCAGRLLGDNVALGYVTVDTVDNFTLRFPGDAGYFAANGAGDATDQNVLWGSWIIVNAAQGFAQGSNMVAVVADGADPAISTPGQYTFYGRYDNWSAVDHRQPLATHFAAQYAVGGAFDAGTSLLVWRDPKVAQGAFDCAATPSWYPLGQEAVAILDEQEHPAMLHCNIVPCPPFTLVPAPAAAQRTGVNSPALPVPFDFGWLHLDLNTAVTAAGPNPPEDPLAAQAWVVVTESSHGRFAAAFDAFRLESACVANHVFF